MQAESIKEIRVKNAFERNLYYITEYISIDNLQVVPCNNISSVVREVLGDWKSIIHTNGMFLVLIQ